jgi:serine-type D-Ala-D-Ala carboxypeptidase (penicillin-binding protein 5/6)
MENQETKNLNTKDISISILIVMIVVVVPIFFMSQSSNSEPEVIEAEKSTAIFENLDLEAEAVFVWDILRQEEIYSRNPEAQLHLASLSKVMMAVTALLHLPESTIITIRNGDLLEEGDNGLFVRERWVLKDLIDFSLLVSSNDGATAVANAVSTHLDVSRPSDDSSEFVGLMNKNAHDIGMAQTYFLNPSGLDKDDLIPGGSGSARDIAILFEYALTRYPSVLEATSYSSIQFDSLDGLEHKAENTNELVSKLPGIIASKTGFTDIAGGNLAIVFEPEPGRPIILVVLGSSLEGRFLDMEKLYLTTLEYIN